MLKAAAQIISVTDVMFFSVCQNYLMVRDILCQGSDFITKTK